MDKKIIFGVIALFFASWFLLLAAPEEKSDSPEMLPWKISHPTPDTIKAFGIVLGKSSLNEAESVFKEKTEISLFKPSNGGMSVEAFVEEVNFNGLKAKMALTIDITPEKMQEMYERGLRMNSTPSGKRITLTSDDMIYIHEQPVASLTYLPNVRLEESVISKRFGQPEMRIQEKDSTVIHWLYPNLGLDIVMSGNEKPVLQYLSPKNFDTLRTPLMKTGVILK